MCILNLYKIQLRKSVRRGKQHHLRRSRNEKRRTGLSYDTVDTAGIFFFYKT